ncbi:choline binding protein A [Streptococcus satellite phage Javan292]|uniref:EbhA n=1 Tax=Streptococcus marmotae TaxID=1825069 RepID=UPI0008343133|nr:EbhA [Streptococcus marmotae]QBX08734.1 choline binding protein A [Streptococcus satellite phage Javan292]QBX08756.1 choline binding protein A [Streptococcus satellite phage Javan293]
MKNKKIWLVATSVIIVLAAVAYYLYIFTPHQNAVNTFEVAKEMVSNKNKKLESSIAEAQELVKADEKPLEDKTLDNLKATLEAANKEKRKIPEIAKKTEDILEQAKELEQPLDYTETETKITDAIKEYQNSITQLKQITNPSQAFIEERLKEVDTVTEVQSVTEANDPNGKLNKQGGYTASVYFADNQVNIPVDGADIVAKGNDVGGNIEVYNTTEDAEKRNTYLSAFDGQGFLDPGSHYVYGSIIIRTSRHLTASQQKELTDKIYNKLIELK